MKSDISYENDEFKIGEVVRCFYPNFSREFYASDGLYVICLGRIRAYSFENYGYRIYPREKVERNKKLGLPFDKYFCWVDEKYIKKGDVMNKLVIEMYPKTKDAVLVDKWFGSKLDDPLFAMLLEGKEEKLLQEAIKLEAEEIAKSKK